MSTEKSGENEKIETFVRELDTLSRTELRIRYPAEYNSWRNGKQRSKELENWSPEFDDFADFLRHLGPCPPGHTLDRIDAKNPLYAPKLVRWASKREQANNRSTTRFVTHDGQLKPQAEAARDAGISPEASRQRQIRSQTDEGAFQQMISDAENGAGRDPRLFRPWPRHREELPANWEAYYKTSGGPRRGNTRYDFFLRALLRYIGEVEDQLDHLLDTGVPKSDPRWNELFEKLGDFRRLQRRAVIEKPIWEDIVRRHERRLSAERNERDALKSKNYLRFEAENNNDEDR